MNNVWSNPPVGPPKVVGPALSTPRDPLVGERPHFTPAADRPRTFEELVEVGVTALTAQLEHTTQSYEAMVTAVLVAVDDAGGLAYREES